MFGKKKRIAELEAELARQDDAILQAAMQLKPPLSENRELKNQVEYLVCTIRQMGDQIRQMDDQIWQMSQCTDWSQMRPHFNTLSDGMTARKVAESDRISDILRPQLIETYNAQTNAPKRLPRT